MVIRHFESSTSRAIYFVTIILQTTYNNTNYNYRYYCFKVRVEFQSQLNSYLSLLRVFIIIIWRMIEFDDEPYNEEAGDKKRHPIIALKGNWSRSHFLRWWTIQLSFGARKALEFGRWQLFYYTYHKVHLLLLLALSWSQGLLTECKSTL